MLTHEFLVPGAKTATMYERACLEGPSSRFCVLLAGFNPQDNRGGEVSLSSHNGCMWLQSMGSWAHRWPRGCLLPMPLPQPGMGPGSLVTFSCWWKSISNRIWTHTAEVVKLYSFSVYPSCSREPALVPFPLPSMEVCGRVGSRTCPKSMFLLSFMKA